MSLLGKYFARELSISIVFVLLGFLALFSFFDLINELDSIGQNGYKLGHALAFVLLSLPARIYEIMPVAVLIGAIYSLAQFAQRSEFTAMRAAGLGRVMALKMLSVVGLGFMAITLLVGEVVAPAADRLAQTVKLQTGSGIKAALTQFRSGVWLKDSVKDGNGTVKLLRFINVGRVEADTSLSDLRIFEFDAGFRLQSQIDAKRARFQLDKGWLLSDVTRSQFRESSYDVPGNGKMRLPELGREQLASLEWGSDITPGIVGMLAVQPEKMTAYALYHYIGHLEQNKQATSRYSIALWKKLMYPLAIFVMLALALPFAYLQVRAGSIGYKVFIGIMIGVGFHFLNGLMSHLGLLNTWPAWISAAAPSFLAFLLALGMLSWVDRLR